VPTTVTEARILALDPLAAWETASGQTGNIVVTGDVISPDTYIPLSASIIGTGDTSWCPEEDYYGHKRITCDMGAVARTGSLLGKATIKKGTVR
jgi:hypothetical protein